MGIATTLNGFSAATSPQAFSPLASALTFHATFPHVRSVAVGAASLGISNRNANVCLESDRSVCAASFLATSTCDSREPSGRTRSAMPRRVMVRSEKERPSLGARTTVPERQGEGARVDEEEEADGST